MTKKYYAPNNHKITIEMNVERLLQLQEKEKKAEKWLAEWNKKQAENIDKNDKSESEIIEKPKKDNFDRLIGCGG
ncbi:MAG: hypothetical protein ACPG5B_00495 [Chitinophagales bacterium]